MEGARSPCRSQQPSAGLHVPEQCYRSHTGTFPIMSQNHMRVPKFDEQNVHLWSSRLQASSTIQELIHALEPTSHPIRIAGGLGGNGGERWVNLSPWAGEG